jgi:hypothetical protein
LIFRKNRCDFASLQPCSHCRGESKCLFHSIICMGVCTIQSSHYSTTSIYHSWEIVHRLAIGPISRFCGIEDNFAVLICCEGNHHNKDTQIQGRHNTQHQVKGENQSRRLEGNKIREKKSGWLWRLPFPIHGI